MKKLVSLLSAVAMLAMLAVPASAALSYNNDMGVYVIDEMPTDAEIAEYAPTLTTSVVKAAAATELKDWSNIALQMKYAAKFSTLDIYKITYDMSGLGAFVNGYDAAFSPSFFGLYNITIGFDGSTLPAGYEITPLKYTLPNGTTGTCSAGVDAGTGVLNALYTAAGVTNDTIYPPIDSEGVGVVSAEGTYKVEYVLAVPAGSSFTLAYDGTKVVYQKNLTNAATTNITCDDIVLGTVVEPEPPVVEPETTIEIVGEKMDLATETAIGAAWDIKITNFDSAKAYQVKFTDAETGENRRDEGFKTLDVSAVAETEGDVAFAIIMNLTAARNVNLDVQVQ